MTSWAIWKNKIASEKGKTISFISLGAKSLQDYFQILLCAMVYEGEDIQFNREEIPPNVLDALDHSVFSRRLLQNYEPSELKGFLKFGTEEIRDFITWGEKSLLYLPKILVSKSHYRELTKARRIRILVIDDSNVIHQFMKIWVSHYSDFEIVGFALDASEGEKLRQGKKPDVIILDINMPGKSGIEYLKDVMSGPDPSRIIIMSSVSRDDAVQAFNALDLGAIDVIEKPEMSRFGEVSGLIAATIRGAAQSVIKRRIPESAIPTTLLRTTDPSHKLILIGCSTGGPEALKIILPQFHEDCPPTLVVQHMPAQFINTLAHRLDNVCRPQVVEAMDGMEVSAGYIYLAPGNRQMKLTTKGDRYIVRVKDDPAVNLCKPSVDYLFLSAAKIPVLRPTVAVVLSGMGNDGANGLLELKKTAGAHTIVQDQDSCSVYGMPRVAAEMGAADENVPAHLIPRRIFEALDKLKVYQPMDTSKAFGLSHR